MQTLTLHAGPVCSLPAVRSSNFGELYSEALLIERHSECIDCDVRCILFGQSTCSFAHACKPACCARTWACRDRLAQLTLSIIPGCRISLSPGNVGHPSPSHLSSQCATRACCASLTDKVAQCHADTMPFLRADTRYVGAWELRPSCLLRQCV